MKRWMTLLTAMLLCLSLLSSASAEAMTLLAAFGNASWVPDTNLLSVESNISCALYAADGTMLTGAAYYGFDYKYGYLSAAKLTGGMSPNAWGLLRMDGSELVPFQYGYVSVENAHWALGYSLVEVEDATQSDFASSSLFSPQVYYKIGSVDVYNLDDSRCVATLDGEVFDCAWANGRYINIFDTDGIGRTYDAQFQLLGEDLELLSDSRYVAEPDTDAVVHFYDPYTDLWGLKNAAGEIVLPPTYFDLGIFVEGYAEVELEEDGPKGLIDQAGNCVVPVAYDEIMHISVADGAENFFGAVRDDRLYFVDANGNITHEVEYVPAAGTFLGASVLYKESEGYRIVAADGVETFLEDLTMLDSPSLAHGHYFVAESAEGSALLDWHGNLLLPYIYEQFSFSDDGHSVLALRDGQWELWG